MNFTFGERDELARARGLVELSDEELKLGEVSSAYLRAHMHPVHMFDQERKRWFLWRDRDWAEEPPPTITRERFAGTGTRSLSDDGKAAIHALFERTFGEV